MTSTIGLRSRPAVSTSTTTSTNATTSTPAISTPATTGAAAPAPAKSTELHQTHFAGSVSSTAERARVTAGQSAATSAVDGFAALNDAPVDDKAKTGSAFGFASLLRLFKSVPAAKSPVALQIQQKGAFNDADAVRNAMSTAMSRVKASGGAAAVGQVVQVVNKAEAQAEKAKHLVDNAAANTEALKANVGLDARLGRVIDWLWFGIPEAHRAYHDSKKDLKASTAFTTELQQAVGTTRTEARSAVGTLLAQENPAVAALTTQRNDVATRLQIAQRLHTLADSAASDLSSADHYIRQRNSTSRTVDVPVFETRTTTDANGVTNEEKVQVGTREESNSTYESYEAQANRAKSSAESTLRELKGVVDVARRLFPDHELQDLGSTSLTTFDFFAQPSFGSWSYDSSEVSAAETRVNALANDARSLEQKLEPALAGLNSKLNAHIDDRWQSLS
jgi:hypothetical protein